MRPECGRNHSESLREEFATAFKSKVDAIKAKEIQPIGEIDQLFQLSQAYYIKGNDQFAATSLSTYAIVNGVKTGDPICDRYGMLRCSNCFVSVIADGCGWSKRSASAASDAVKGSMDFLYNNINQARTTHDIATMLIDAFYHAHLEV